MAYSSSPIPVLPHNELNAFVKGFLDRKTLFLKTAKQHGSPLWIIESSVFTGNANRFSRAFNRFFPDTAFYYAMKSNNHPGMSALALASGFGLDVSGEMEIKTALNLNARDIIFSGPGKTDAEIRLAVAHNRQITLLVDSFGELDRLNALCRKNPPKGPVNVGIRVNTDPQGLWRKFGIELKALPHFWEQVRQVPMIRFKGIQCHTSWNLSPDRQISCVRALGDTMETMPEAFKQQIEFIDIGGGYWPEEGEWLRQGTVLASPENRPGEQPVVPLHYRQPARPIEEFAHSLYTAFATCIFPRVNCRVCFEPGRWLCHSAMHLILTVVDKKAPDLVITDAGTNAIGWERFETDYFPVINLTRPSLSERSCNILGALCTPNDFWGDTYFGEGIEPGDLLMIPCQGAYTYSLGQSFIKALPRVVVL